MENPDLAYAYKERELHALHVSLHIASRTTGHPIILLQCAFDCICHLCPGKGRLQTSHREHLAEGEADNPGKAALGLGR